MNQLKNLFQKVIRILLQAVRSFYGADAAEGAASMAYYALFSLFPLLLVLVAAGSFVLESEEAQKRVLEYITRGIPISQRFIERNIHRLFELRGTVGILGMIGLLWSASGFFTTLAYHLERAWPKVRSRSFLGRRLIALGMVSSLAGLLILSLMAITVIRLMPQFLLSLWARVSIPAALIWTVLSSLIPWALIFFMLLGLYRWVPNTEVRWSEALWAALVAALGMEATTAAFTWYLSSGLARYQLIYGSLGAVVALMLWIYLNSLIVLFGGHLSSAIVQVGRPSSNQTSGAGMPEDP